MAEAATSRPVQTQVLGGVEKKKSSSGAKMTVACNLPAGLRIRGYNMVPDRELVMGGGSREITRAEPIGESILIRGVAHELEKAPRAPIVGGYAITYGVDKEIWDNWYDANKDSKMVKNRCIFAYEERSLTLGAAKEAAGTLSGLEPFAQEGDPRRPIPRGNITEPVAEEEQAERRARDAVVE